MEYFTFKNYYTASISIMAKVEFNWKFILSDFKIMENPDCEEESEKYVMIHKSKLNFSGLEIKKIEKMRIFLFQPHSNLFKKYRISNFKIFTSNIYEEIKSNFEKKGNINLGSISLNKFYLGSGKFYIDKNSVLCTDKGEIMSNLIELCKYSDKPEFKILY